MWRRFSSLFNLAVALFTTALRRLWVGRSSLKRFAEHYQPEGILALTPQEAESLARAGRCIACGQCDQTAVSSDSSVRGATIMGFVLAGTRSLPDYAASARDLESFSEQRLLLAERVCPRKVPIVELSRLVRGYDQRLRNQGSS